MTRMRATNAFLANYAEVRNDLVNALGAFPEWWDVPALPFAAVIHMVVLLELEPDEVGQVFTIDVALERPGGDSGLVSVLKTQRRPSEKVLGTPIYLRVAVPCPINVGELGPHALVLASDGEILARVPFGIRVVPPPDDLLRP